MLFKRNWRRKYYVAFHPFISLTGDFNHLSVLTCVLHEVNLDFEEMAQQAHREAIPKFLQVIATPASQFPNGDYDHYIEIALRGLINTAADRKSRIIV